MTRRARRGVLMVKADGETPSPVPIPPLEQTTPWFVPEEPDAEAEKEVPCPSPKPSRP